MNEDIFIKTPYRDEALWVVQYIEDRINRNGGWASVIDLMDILSFSPASISYSIPYEYQSKNYGWTCLNGIAVKLTADPYLNLYEVRLPKPIKINDEGENDMFIEKPILDLKSICSDICNTMSITSNTSSAINTAVASSTVMVPSPCFSKPDILDKNFNCCTNSGSRNSTNVLPKAIKVETYNNRVVKVTFADGTFTKSVCSENDIFDLDVGITICLFKRILGKDGHKEYNDLIRNVHKTMEKNEEEKRKKKEQDEKKRKKQRKETMAKAAKKLKAKEEAIDIRVQAIIRAKEKLNTGSLEGIYE